MFEWIFLLFAPPVPYEAPPAPPAQDYIGMVAAEAAYTTLLPRAPEPDKPKPPPVDPANCPTCKNSGRPGWVRTGDGHEWTKCPTCQPITAPAPAPEKPALPKAKSTLPPGPFPKPQVKAQTSALPPLTPAVTGPCATGVCPVEKAAPAAPLSGFPIFPVPVSPRRLFRRR
jgi:hypothetical protein